MNQNRQTMLVIATVVATFLGFVFFLDPTQTRWLPACPLHELTGFYCPGCGATRALHCLLYGEFARALHFNPLIVAAPFLLGAIAVSPRKTCHSAAGWAVLAVVILFGVLRNIPLEFFQVLRP